MEQRSEAEQLFEGWQDRIPEQARVEILAYFSGARARLSEICEEIAGEHPQVRGELARISRSGVLRYRRLEPANRPRMTNTIATPIKKPRLYWLPSLCTSYI